MTSLSVATAAEGSAQQTACLQRVEKRAGPRNCNYVHRCLGARVITACQAASPATTSARSPAHAEGPALYLLETGYKLTIIESPAA